MIGKNELQASIETILVLQEPNPYQNPFAQN
jgi:hypothetical protein